MGKLQVEANPGEETCGESKLGSQKEILRTDTASLMGRLEWLEMLGGESDAKK